LKEKEDIMLQQADDFLAECDALAEVLETLTPADWTRPTLFKDWTANDVMVHLHFWNKAADLSANDEDAFMRFYTAMAADVKTQGRRAAEGNEVPERGPELLALWRDHAHNMAARWRPLDPKKRVKWAGPDMSVRSSITARQMETWAHGLAIFDVMGAERSESDRLRNIVVLGVNTYGWTFMVRDLTPPEPMPRLNLTAPSGGVWSFGPEDAPAQITGSALDFCYVVTQTRSYADTSLHIHGAAAEQWMHQAQCFAGPPETPPAKGARHRAKA
jgi:uncharacterized protein (TIGR03084 family)